MLGPVDLQIDWADRVAITGPNGAGKSTLLAALLGRAPPGGRERCTRPGVVVGEVDQARSLFNGSGVLARTFGELVPFVAGCRRPDAAGSVRLRSDARRATGGHPVAR